MNFEIGNGEFHVGNCFDVMRELSDASVDMILCDLPYGTTACKWDSVLPFDALWAEYNRIAKRDAAIVLTASEPFTSVLVSINFGAFKHRWIWDKVKPSSGLRAKFEPLRVTEDVVVSCRGRTPYRPQMVAKDHRKEDKFDGNGDAFGDAKVFRHHDNKGLGYPKDLLTISNADQHNRIHPTQKPVALFEYLIHTYTNPGEVVLDNTAGSGTTAIAAENAERRWICIERDEDYATKAMERIRRHVSSEVSAPMRTPRAPAAECGAHQASLFG